MSSPPPRPPDFTLEAFADPTTVKSIVKGILHTIFFHRFFPTVVPLEQEILDGIFVPKISDAELETLIDSHSGLVAHQLDAERSGRGTGSSAGLRTQVIVTFRDKKRAGPRKGRAGTLTGTSAASAAGNTQSGTTTTGTGTVSSKPTTITGASPSASPTSGTSSKPWYASAAAAGLNLVTTLPSSLSPSPSSPSPSPSDEIIWERWIIRVSVAEPKTESERLKVRRAAEQTLQSTIFKIVTVVNNHKDHIPPITTTDANPFPYAIDIGASASTNAHVGGSSAQKVGRAVGGGAGAGGTAGNVAATASAGGSGGWGGRLFSGY